MEGIKKVTQWGPISERQCLPWVNGCLDRQGKLWPQSNGSIKDRGQAEVVRVSHRNPHCRDEQGKEEFLRYQD